MRKVLAAERDRHLFLPFHDKVPKSVRIAMAGHLAPTRQSGRLRGSLGAYEAAWKKRMRQHPLPILGLDEGVIRLQRHR